ncbi:restriction endonuclease subunit S [Parendozoicomonas haliclonae]|uniref:EcoKI restriction-modification system protein HsdS n=1 Tax=Parendozoicomonas haliclonae TaxID=1960125 RepID=A0A1X7AF36_9GAMM|nr:restriction endonuclease subunit S [Parendozoicomonas haliclonae]SMA36354.1 EcoKI restriction-modification system protein HsdS [Parendozoicomonas haliclonae]
MTDSVITASHKLITDNLPLWTAAHTTKSSAGRGTSSKLNLHGIKKLRELILELAVRGKLVPPEGGNERALENLLSKEIDRVLSVNKGKKPAMTAGAESWEKPQVPPSWRVMRVNELLLTQQGVQIAKSAQITEPHSGFKRYLYISDFKHDNSLKFVEDKYPGKEVTPNDLVMANTGSPGEVYYGVDGILSNNLFKISFNSEIFNQTYVYLFFKSPLFISRLNQSIKGGAQQHLGHKLIGSQYISVPPLYEQHRIVARVNELMALCDKLEQQQTTNITAHETLVETLLAALTRSSTPEETAENWARIAEHFDTLFTTEHSVDQLKQTILQLAVMGKLVPQNPDDEPASALLARIADEKARLVAEGKIKKQKPLPAITDDEKPFALPVGWEWCRLAHAGYDLGGGTPSKSKGEYWNGDIPWVSPKDMKTDYISNTVDSITERALKETTIKLVPTGSLLMVVRGMILAHSFPVALTKRPVTINQDMKALVYSELKPEFLLLLMKGLKDDLVALVDRSTHGTCKLVSDKLWLKVLAIPPNEEQHRIVTKVNELMTLCDHLKANIQQAKQTNLHFADAVVERALG